MSCCYVCNCPFFLNSCTHKVLGYSKEDCPEYSLTEEVILLSVKNPEAVDGERFNIRFCGQVPTGDTSLDLYVTINETEIPLKNYCTGEIINTSSLKPCDVICGIYVADRCPYLKVYRIM